MLMSRDDIARLCTHLVVPIVVSDILHNKSSLTDEIQYGLHEMLSNMEPDTALLAISISAQHIAVRYVPDCPMALPLALEAEKIYDEYAFDWLANADGKEIGRDHQALVNLLKHVPEDLQMITDLIRSVQTEIHDETDPAWLLCDILVLQANAHMEISEYILEHGGEFHDEIGFIGANDSLEHSVPPEIAQQATKADNIILFPGNPR